MVAGLTRENIRLCSTWHTAFGGADTKIRTRDLLITNQLLYQLSYAGVGAIIEIAGEGGKQ
jgi:hypothetical protein